MINKNCATSRNSVIKYTEGEKTVLLETNILQRSEANFLNELLLSLLITKKLYLSASYVKNIKKHFKKIYAIQEESGEKIVFLEETDFYPSLIIQLELDYYRKRYFLKKIISDGISFVGSKSPYEKGFELKLN